MAMPTGTFEAFVRETVEFVEKRLRRELSKDAQPFDELSLGYDQGKLFYRWAAGDDGAEIQKIIDAPEISVPPLDERWADDYDEDDWDDAWGEGLARLAVLATGAALIEIRDGKRLPNGFSVKWKLGVYDDVDAPSSCDPLSWVDDELKSGKGAPVEALFEKPETLAWVRRLAATKGPMTIAAIEKAMGRASKKSASSR
jgi:hypothetical protein